METIAILLKIDGGHASHSLLDAADKLADRDLILDCSSLRHVDPSAVTALEKLAGAADAKSIKVVLRGVNVAIYKVLKLANLAHHFSFVT